MTFLTTCYILAVNSAILTDSGGPCTDADCTGPLAGQPGCRFHRDSGFDACLAATRRSLVAATAATSAIGCLLMGVVANLPLAVCPGMGVNAFFAYTVVGYLGTGRISYREALAAVFVEGWIFIFDAVVGVRASLIAMVPKALMLSTAGGIGLFLAFIGLQKSEGIGLIAMDPTTLVTLGGCPRANQVPVYTLIDPTPSGVCKADAVTGTLKLEIGAPSANIRCLEGRMHSPTLWLGVAAFLIIAVLMSKRVKGSIMAGIVFATVVSWIPGHGASYLGPNAEIPGGEARMETFRRIVSVPDASKTSLTWSFAAFGTPQLWIALVTFLYLDLLDTTGTFFSMSQLLNRFLPGFVNEANAFPRQLLAFVVDGVSIIIGSLLGCAPLTTYIESASGIREGGRTGLTAVVTSFGYFLALFFTPLIVSIPPYASGPALVVVGALMMESVVDIEWSSPRQAIPAFLTITLMPLTYSIAYGLVAGIGSYLAIHCMLLVIDMTSAVATRRPVRLVLLQYLPSPCARCCRLNGDRRANGAAPGKAQALHEDPPAEIQLQVEPRSAPDAK